MTEWNWLPMLDRLPMMSVKRAKLPALRVS